MSINPEIDLTRVHNVMGVYPVSTENRFYRLVSITVIVSLIGQLFMLPVSVWASTQSPAAQAASLLSATHTRETLGATQALMGGALGSFSTQSAAVQARPQALEAPLSVSRVQSDYQADGSVTITYTLKNTLAPQVLPEVSTGATPGEVVGAMADYDLSADPNVLRNVVLVVLPTVDSNVLATSVPADAANDQFVFLLDTLPPQVSTTVVVTATTPTSVSEPTPLIDATGWASLNGHEVKADAAQAVVLPESLSDWLIRTIDADTTDEEMLQALAQTGGDPDAIFAWVRGFGFETYRGSLRGTRGTLWSGAGNSLDQSSLLIAMLRASGIPARYRHGTLSEADAQTLIAGMFPAPTAMIGQVAPEIPVSDPVNDPDLIAEVQDHWWVEAYVDGAWTDLDPTFAGAAIGQRFASQVATDGTDRIAELTDDVRPKVRIKLDVEMYNQLNVGGQPQVETYLDHTFRVVEIATASVVFAHYVTTEAQGGLVYGSTSHTYTPFLHINDNDEIIFGEPYQELVTNFPLATTFVTGAWLHFELEDIDGEVTSYERTLRDRLGYEIRTYGGTPDIVLDDSSPPIFSEFDIYSLSFFPGVVPREVFEARQGALTGVLAELADDTDRMQALAALAPLDAAQQSEASQIRARYQFNLSLFLNNVSMSFAEAADRASRISQKGLFVKAYHDDPRLVIISHEVVSDTSEINVDLRTTLERTIAHPGQGEPATFGFNLFKGINESWLEGEVLASMTDATVLTTEAVMSAAFEQDIPFAFISETNLDLLNTIGLGAEAQARITTAVLDGKIVNIPTTAPLINGEPAIGWWEIDPETGETIGVMENGLHNALIEFFVSLLFGTTVGRLTDFMIGATAATWDFVGQQFFKATGSGEFGTPANDALSKTNQGLACLMGDVAGCIGGKGYLDYGYMAMDAYLSYRNKNDPPLTDLLLGNTIFTPTQSVATITLDVPANATVGSITADLQTDFTQLSDAGGGLSFYAAALDPLASGSSDGATAVNHVDSTSLTLTDAAVQIAAPGGSLTVGGQPLALGDGLAIAGFDGTLDLTAATVESDELLLNGTGDVFALTTVPDSTTITPIDTATFDVDLTTTSADVFTVTVSAPENWEVALDDAGQVTATPPSGTAPADYTLVVTAQSTSFPGLILTAEHTVTITSYEGLQLDLVPDPLITVPMGPELPESGFINTGQAQVPGAAYMIELTNTSNTPRTYSLTVSGLPAGSVLLGGESGSTTLDLSLPAGALGQVGLYVTPDSLLPEGTAYNISVTATDENGLNASDTEIFTMPAVPFSYVTVEPATRAVTTTSTTSYDVTIQNVGNAAGDFGLAAEAYIFDGSVTFGSLPAPVTIPASGSATFPITVSTSDAPTRSSVPLLFSSPVANTVYTPTAIVELQVVSAEAEPILNAASVCELPPAVDAAFLSLASAVDELSYWCEQGDCPLPLRDGVVTAGESLVTYAQIAAQPTTLPALSDVETALADLAAQTGDVEILDAVADLGAVLQPLGLQLCEVEQHRVDARFVPYVDAILLGEAADFSLDVTNEGAVTTTYAITVTGLPGSDLVFNESIVPGTTLNLPITPTPADLGVFDLSATVIPVAPDVTLAIEETAVARLNVVDKFVQVMEVIADPPFVETGTSATDLSVEIANPSGVAQAGDAHTAVLAPDGSTVFSTTVPLTVLAGTPRVYDLSSADTSGWTEGTYTVTVDLLDDRGDLIPDGSGYGYIEVGQGLVASQAVDPTVVVPGTVTVTTLITTELTQDYIPPEPLSLNVEAAPQRANVETSRPPLDSDVDQTDAGSLLEGPDPADLVEETNIVETEPELSYPLSPTGETFAVDTTEDGEEMDVTVQSPGLLNVSVGGVFTRTEQDDPTMVYTGTWSSFNTNRASGGSFTRADTAGESVEFIFSGTWVNVGFLGNRFSGYAEVFIDGASQGVVDLYRREEVPISYIYDGLLNAMHTISITALGTANPYASREYVQLDYIDAWDGSDLPDGTFEQDATRVITTTGWWTINDATASGGTYYRDNVASAWFPFSGDSFTYHAVRRNGLGWTRLYVDGEYLTSLYLYNPDVVTETYSFDGFGPGPHILQVSGYRANMTIDAFTQPGTVPFEDPDAATSYMRYEEDHPAWSYNGQPFVRAAQSWQRREFGLATVTSGSQIIGTGALSDTAVITVTGEWVQLGFGGDSNSGTAEVFIDGVSQGIIDLYRNEYQIVSRTFPDLASGTHTISITLRSGQMWIDYVDVWDGTPLADGTFEAFPSDRFYWSGDWGLVNDGNAIGGQYLRTDSGTAWFPFTGDSVSYRAFAYSGADESRIYLDDQFIGTLDLFNTTDISRTFSFDGLGSGVHLLRIEHHRGNITLEQFVTPATGSAYDPPAPTGIIRYEEDDPALLYNGVPFTQTATSWDYNNSYENRASEGYVVQSSTPGDNVSLPFNGSWFGVGFLSWRNRGIADIYLDGTLLDSVDLFTLPEDTKSVYYDVAPGTHTISVTVSGNSHPNAVGTEIAIDYIDVWDGTPESDGTFEETDRDRLIYSPGWTYYSEPAASGGGYAGSGRTDNKTVWFPFTGDAVTYRAWANYYAHEIKIRIDGQPMGTDGVFDIFAYDALSRTISFDGLGAGPHVMEISGYRYDLTLDSFATPGIAPFYETPPAPTGIVRYEEDDPALLYNGYPYEQSEYCWLNCWGIGLYRSTSNAYAAETRRVGDWVSLDFYGSWAGVGFGTSTGVAEVFIDGTSMITVDLSLGEDVTSVYFDDLITGTHTISVSLVSGRMEFDFFDVWDGTEMGDGWFEADLDEHRGPFHYSALSSWATDDSTQSFNERLAFARDEDVLSRGRISFPTHMWFGFTGNDLRFLPFQGDGKTVEVFINGVSQGVIDLTPEYSTQPVAYYFTDLGEGPHVVHVNAVDDPRIDAFQVNPPDTLPYTPVVEWHSAAPTDVYTDTYANGGLLSTAGIGDLDGDGLVEIVAPSSNGQLYVYRGDGQDTGDGDPILWQSDLVGGAAEPSLADLDGDGDAEIVLVGSDGTAAFHHDGVVYWFTDTIRSIVENTGWGGSSIANLDLEPGPEIVLAAHNDALYVLDHDGTLLFSEPTGRFPAVPTLADVTGDGFQDIIFAQDRTLTVYDAFNNFNIAWTHTHTYTGFYGQAFGAPAVVDVDGKQPGGDDGPEVVVNWGHYIDVFDADGTLLWNYYTGDDFFYRPSPITVADVDGDNEIELLTASAWRSGFLVFYHRLFVLNADGTLLWSQDMGDTTSSASGVATQDLDGDGVWEVLWNGLNEGFTIMNGPTGRKIFNEEYSESGTFVDYPAVGDVDGDGFAEVVTGGRNGLYVIGHDEEWGDSRPIWNQHNYHITNINDDWSVPINAFNSWEVHNTYRTQTPDRNPAPSYQISFTYTEGITGVTVLTDTASVSLTAAPPTYTWAYRQEWYQPVITTTFDSLLSDMQPGEVRQVAAGTEIVYDLPGGINTVTLPPLYVTAPHIVALDPSAETLVAGEATVFTATLTNPGTAADTYTLSGAGPIADWVDLPSTVPVPAESAVTVPLTVTVPADTDPDTLPFLLDVSTGGGGADQAMAMLTVVDGVDLSMTPAIQYGGYGEPVTYTLVIINPTSSERTYDLTATGLPVVTLPPNVTVAAGETVSVSVTASAESEGQLPFTVFASSEGISESVDATLANRGRRGVTATLAPDPALSGPGVTTPLTLTLSNAGSLEDTYDLTVDVPAGWTAYLEVNGTVIDAITLPPHLFHTADLRLLVTPAVGSAPGNYPVTVTAVSRSDVGVTAGATGTVQVTDRGVEVALSPADQTIPANQSATWDVTVTNRGSLPDTFDLAATGLAGASGTFVPDSVSLAPGASQTVQLTMDNLDFVLSGTYDVTVLATSQADPAIQAMDRGTLTVTGYEGVTVSWYPATQTVTDTLEATYTLVITNAGNGLTSYELAFTVPGGSAQAGLAQVSVPAPGTAVLPVTVQVPGEGTYPIEGTATSTGATASQTAELTVVIEEANVAPVADAGPDQEVEAGTDVALDGSASSDEDGNLPLVYDWTQIGEPSVSLSDATTASPTFTAPNTSGVLTFTLTVTDSLGLADPSPDTVVITVTEAASPSLTIYLPLISRD